MLVDKWWGEELYQFTKNQISLKINLSIYDKLFKIYSKAMMEKRKTNIFNRIITSQLSPLQRLKIMHGN